MLYEPTIGIEAHAQLTTSTKMFCACRTAPVLTGAAGGRAAPEANAPANSLLCPVCLGLPGALPVINERAVELGVSVALALHCRINTSTRFDRKNYAYPDLPKGYQISQYFTPLGGDGWLELQTGDAGRRVRIQDVHLEEDTGKLIHQPGRTLIDLNRAGIPLLEVVTRPDLHSAEEAHLYAVELRRYLLYLGACSGDLEKGALRFEANVSVRPAGSLEPGTRVEVKNLNSLRALRRSIEFELSRQEALLRQGLAVRRETRGWDETGQCTVVQRSKESAEDYRYFPEPDLPPLELSTQWLEALRAQLPELPAERRRRFTTEYGLSSYDADLLTDEPAIANYFESAVSHSRLPGLSPKTIANWVSGDLLRYVRQAAWQEVERAVPPDRLVELIAMQQAGSLTQTSAKQVLQEMLASGQSARQICAEKHIERIADEASLGEFLAQVIAANPEAVSQYRTGKDAVLRFLVGAVVKASHGTADPTAAAELLRRRLRP